MPALIREPFPGSPEHSSDISDSHVLAIEDSQYPAQSFNDYSEKPLSEQLEAIAVVGMGMLKKSALLDNSLSEESLVSCFDTNADRLSSSWRYQLSTEVLGNDDEQKFGPDPESSVFSIQY